MQVATVRFRALGPSAPISVERRCPFWQGESAGAGPAPTMVIGAGGAHRATAQQSDAHQARTERNLSGPASVVALLRHSGMTETVWFWGGVLLAHPKQRKERLLHPASFLSALCSTLAGGHGLMGRDALRPDAIRRLRGAAEGKGGAAWRRDRTRAQPRAAAPWRRAWRARGGPTPCPQRAPWHSCCERQAKLSTAEKFNYFLSSI